MIYIFTIFHRIVGFDNKIYYFNLQKIYEFFLRLIVYRRFIYDECEK